MEPVAGDTPYPLQYSVDYPDRDLNRLTTAFRLIVAIPILIVAGSIGGHEEAFGAGRHAGTIGAGLGGLLFLAPLLIIVFRQKYPRWWFDWNLELLRFSNRIGVYLALMDDRYPSTEEDRKSTRLNSSHRTISYAVFCLKKKKSRQPIHHHQHRYRTYHP